MGYAERANGQLRQLLTGFRVALDVQHLYKADQPGDQGSVFAVPIVGGPLGATTRYTEAHAATLYAQAAASWLAARGAAVLTNDPTHHILVGSYPQRNHAADAWKAHVYLACHVNAGGGRYAAIEAMAASPGLGLVRPIGLALTGSSALPEIGEYRAIGLSRGDRGPVCIESFHGGAAALVEPFFGDNAGMRPLLAAGRLQQVGEAIALGLAGWWKVRQGQPA